MSGVPAELTTAPDFIGVRAALIRFFREIDAAESRRNSRGANEAIVWEHISFRTNLNWRDAYVDDEHVVWWRATYEEIAEGTGLSRDQVKRALQWLLSHGFLEASPPEGMKTAGYGTGYRTVLEEEDGGRLRPNVRATKPTPRASTPESRASTPERPSLKKEKTNNARVHDAPTREEPPPGQSEDHLFELWWNEYPAHVGRGAARTAWRAARKLASPSELIAGAKRYAAHLQRHPDLNVRYPAGWLADERWSDEYDPPAAPRKNRLPMYTGDDLGATA